MPRASERFYDVMKSGDLTEIALNGHIGHEFNVPLVEFAGARILRVNMHKVGLITSEGTRLFVKWLWEIERSCSDLKLQIEKVSPILVRQFNTVRGHWTPNIQVTTVYAPFFCEGCEYEDHSQLVTAQEYARSVHEHEDFMPKPIICPKCHKPMELDCDPEKYFVILKRADSNRKGSR